MLGFAPTLVEYVLCALATMPITQKTKKKWIGARRQGAHFNQPIVIPSSDPLLKDCNQQQGPPIEI